MTYHDELDALLGAGPHGPDAELGAALSRLGRPTGAPAPRPTAALAAYLPLAIASGRTSAPAAPESLDLLARPPAPRRLVVPPVVGRVAVAAVAIAAVAASVVVGQALRAGPTTPVRVVTPAGNGDDAVDPSTTTRPPAVVAPPSTTDPASTSTDRGGRVPATAGSMTSGVSTSGHGGVTAVRPTDDRTPASERATPEPSSTDRTPSTTDRSEPSTTEPSTSDGSSGGSSPETTSGDVSGGGHDAPSGETTAQDTGGG